MQTLIYRCINTGEFLQSEIPGVLLARQHGKENHWEDVTS